MTTDGKRLAEYWALLIAALIVTVVGVAGIQVLEAVLYPPCEPWVPGKTEFCNEAPNMDVASIGFGALGSAAAGALIARMRRIYRHPDDEEAT